MKGLVDMKITNAALALAIAVSPLPAIAKAPENAVVERTAPDRLRVSWTGSDAVDVYMSTRSDAAPAVAARLSAGDRDGRHDVAAPKAERVYFLLRDSRTGDTVRVAERLVPLERGSNFRDVGGYPAAGGKHVRWGMIYRSGATPVLSETDLHAVHGLGLANLVDLRSIEERQLAPTRIDGVPYNAVGYSMNEIFSAMRPAGEADNAPVRNGSALYRRMPEMLAPQMRVLFSRLLAKEGPVAYNCSAGQDRTGFATAVILSALGVTRETIVRDYHLSTTYRQPQFEMAKFDPAAFPDNAAAKMFSRYRDAPSEAKPKPLKEADGTAFISAALDEIDRTYGSVETYLDKVAGVDANDIAALRAAYLE